MKKKMLHWVLILALIVTLLPVSLGNQVQAATGAGYFFPDSKELGKTANFIDLKDDAASDAGLQRANVYISSGKTMSINGSFQGVETNSLSIRVDQLKKKSPAGWEADPDHYNIASVTVDANSTSRFQANTVELFPGYNRITISGKQGNTQPADSFFVLYEEAPYLQNLKALSGSTQPQYLNEGVKTVVTNKVISFEGKAPNATEVVINGFSTSPLGDGTFYISGVPLNPGLNTISITLKTATSKVDLKRQVYLYDTAHPYSRVNIEHIGDSPASILDANNQPVLTGQTSTGTNDERADLDIEMLVPYSSAPFSSSDVNQYININAATPGKPSDIGFDPASLKEETIKGSDGVTNAYKLINFKTNLYSFPAASNQTVTLNVYYNSLLTLNSGFKYYPGDTKISNMQLITENVQPVGTEYKITGTTGTTPLNNGEVNKSDFYIVVESDKAIGSDSSATPAVPGQTLHVKFPDGTVNDLAAETNWNYYDSNASGVQILNKKKEIYHVTNLPSGVSSLLFYFSSANQSTYSAVVTRVSKNYIYLENPLDGQVVNYNSKSEPGKTITIKGQFIGFENVQQPQYEFFINGKTPYVDPSNAASAPLFTLDTTGTPPLLKFTANAVIGTHLNIGENRIRIVGRYQEGGSTREVSKEVKIVIFDTNIPTILKLQPSYIKRKADNTLDRVAITDPALFTVLPEQFQNKSGKYVTSLKEYDLVFQLSGVDRVRLTQGGSEVLADQPVTNFAIGAVANVDCNPCTSASSVIRVKDRLFNNPGSHIYTLEATNSNGAKNTQTLEIVREPSGFRKVSPVPTVDDKIVVNKNFVDVILEAEAAQEVLIDGKPAVRLEGTDMYRATFMGLKPNKENAIKLQIKRNGTAPINDTLKVYYTNSNQNYEQFMEPLSTKHSVFNGALNLTFPKGTILKSANPNDPKNFKFYESQNLLFGLADPGTGTVALRDDTGNTINNNEGLVANFTATSVLRHFSRISDVYWLSAGYGESSTNKKLDGVLPVFKDGNDVRAYTDPQLTSRRLVPTERGTITLKFDPSVVQDAGTVLSVLMLNDQGQWKILGGEVDTAKNTITVPFDQFGYYMVGKGKSSFLDVTRHGWARNILSAMFAKGYMPALYYNDMGADENITRGEFAAILVKAFNLPLITDDKNTFVDVMPGSSSPKWDYYSIETAARAGIVSGMENNVFAADQLLERQQAATMIARAKELKLSMRGDKLDASLDKIFTDRPQIDSYARPAVEGVYKAKIMEGIPNVLFQGQKQSYRFEPKAYLTRAQAAQIAVRVIQSGSSKVFPKNFD